MFPKYQEEELPLLEMIVNRAFRYVSGDCDNGH